MRRRPCRAPDSTAGGMPDSAAALRPSRRYVLMCAPWRCRAKGKHRAMLPAHEKKKGLRAGCGRALREFFLFRAGAICATGYRPSQPGSSQLPAAPAIPG